MKQGIKDKGDFQKTSTAQRVESGLVAEISIGELLPGVRLDEVSLAKRFGASRTPVREALSRLTAQGILVYGERRGVFVAKYTRKQLGQIFETMHELEITCARIAAKRLDLLSRSEIEAAQAECMRAAGSGDKIAYLHANENFHLAIYNATGNPYMADISIEFRRRTGPFRAKKFRSSEDLLIAAKSHEPLIAGIFSEDPTMASDSMRLHMTEDFVSALKVY